ncbi:MAG TPA: hypothetical protein VD994_02115 [Prosthecobacter sp.]|nr:hypothetical protein [Prosthecobacter sp.]
MPELEPSSNPHAPPRSQVVVENLRLDIQVYEGIGRPGFIITYALIIFVGSSLSSGTGMPGPIMLLTALLMLLPVSSRLKNIGRNSAWCVLLFVPIINLFVIVPCLLLPPGYQDSRKLDLPAKILAGLLVAALLAFLFWVFTALQVA